MPLTQDQKLKRQGDIVNAKDLHYAIRNGNCGLLEKLCESGADPNQPDEDGNLPLNAAISKDSPEMVSILCRFGANTNLPDKFGKFPLHRAIQKNSSMMVRILCEFGANLSYIKIFGDRLVTRAARVFSGGHDFCAGFPHGLSDNLNLSNSSAPHFHLFLDRCRTILLRLIP